MLLGGGGDGCQLLRKKNPPCVVFAIRGPLVSTMDSMEQIQMELMTIIFVVSLLF